MAFLDIFPSIVSDNPLRDIALLFLSGLFCVCVSNIKPRR
jgi:hypothetical protein